MRRILTVMMLPALLVAAAGCTRAGRQTAVAKQDGGVQQVADVMHDMSELMTDMSGRLSPGAMSDEARQRMAAQMQQMAGMMDQMSGMMDRLSPGMMGGGMMDPDMRSRMEQMQEHMSEMMTQWPGSRADG